MNDTDTLAFALLVGVASMLGSRRDVGSGILAQRRGHAEASPRLLSPFGLVWRLQRSALLGWAVAMAGFGLVFGAGAVWSFLDLTRMRLRRKAASPQAPGREQDDR